MILSVDMAHAIHPNYASKHEKGHAPTMNEGLVIKTNSNQRCVPRPRSAAVPFHRPPHRPAPRHTSPISTSPPFPSASTNTAAAAATTAAAAATTTTTTTTTTAAAVAATWPCQDGQTMDRLLQEVLDMGGEGLILRRQSSVFRPGVSAARDMLKVKAFADAEALIIMPVEGRPQKGAVHVRCLNGEAAGRVLHHNSGFLPTM